MADLAAAGQQVVIDLLVRRFLCPAAGCDRRTFVEQVDGLTERFVRRTPLLRRSLEKMALALAGRPGARLAAHLSIPANPSLIRLVLWRNLCEAVEKCVAVHRRCLAEPTEDTPAGTTAEPEVPVRPEGMRVTRRRGRHATVHALYDKGVPIQAIPDVLGLDRKTVHRYAHAATPQDASLATGSRRQGEIHAYSPYPQRRWNEGCTDAARLHTEISELGFTGSKRTVRRHPQENRASGKPAPDKPKTLTVRTATWLITSHPDHLDERSTLKLKKLLARSPELDAVTLCSRPQEVDQNRTT
ncbi:putative transposase [Streptomyces sp. NBRC 110611]|nr:putative transposase [Streptomyces sp. NBRC 110611]